MISLHAKLRQNLNCRNSVKDIGTYREDRQADMIRVVGVYVGLFIEKSWYKNRAYCSYMFIDDGLIKPIPTQTRRNAIRTTPTVFCLLI